MLLYSGLSLISLTVILSGTSLLELAQSRLGIKEAAISIFSGSGITDFVIVLAGVLFLIVIGFFLDGYRRLRKLKMQQVAIKNFFVLVLLLMTVIFIVLMGLNIWSFY